MRGHFVVMVVGYSSSLGRIRAISRHIHSGGNSRTGVLSIGKQTNQTIKPFTFVNKTAMRKQPETYPVNGPSLRIQNLMKRPQANKKELRLWAKANPQMRPETLAHIK